MDEKLRGSQRFKDTLELASDSKYQNMLKYWSCDLCRASPELFNLVVILGGSETVLYASNLFQGYVPPVIIFSPGSLSFIADYAFQKYGSTLDRVMGEMGGLVCQRTRLTCTVLRKDAKSPVESAHTAGPDEDTIHEQFVVLNELKIGSEGSSYLPFLELYANGAILTYVQEDGVIFATATGSTAYNLSARGPLLHPSLPCIILNAISPHTLSFRPIILPSDMVLTVLVPKGSRSKAYAYFDGMSRIELHQGDRVQIDTSAVLSRLSIAITQHSNGLRAYIPHSPTAITQQRRITTQRAESRQ